MQSIKVMGGALSIPSCKGVNHGQPRQARPRSKEAEKSEGQIGACEISVRTHSGEAHSLERTARSRNRTTKVKGSETTPFHECRVGQRRDVKMARQPGFQRTWTAAWMESESAA